MLIFSGLPRQEGHRTLLISGDESTLSLLPQLTSVAEPELSQAAFPVTLDAFCSWFLSFVLPCLQAQPFAVPWAGEASVLSHLIPVAARGLPQLLVPEEGFWFSAMLGRSRHFLSLPFFPHHLQPPQCRTSTTRKAKVTGRDCTWLEL